MPVDSPPEKADRIDAIRQAVRRRRVVKAIVGGPYDEQAGRCPRCQWPLVPYLGPDGPAFTCDCTGPEKGARKRAHLAMKRLKVLNKAARKQKPQRLPRRPPQ